MNGKPIYVTKPHLPPLEDFIPYLEEIWASGCLTNGGPMHQRLERELAEVQRELNRLQNQGDSGAAMMALLGKKQRMIRTLEAMKPPKELQ